MKKILINSILAIFTICLMGCATDLPTIDSKHEISLDVKEKTLSNGLKILVVENSKLPIFSYYSYYKVGGKFESEGITGASHYLEHMMFKGAKKYGLNKFDDIIEGNGGNNNAYTSNDLTVYYENLPSDTLELIIDVEADRMQNLLLEKNAFEQERKVILEERRMRYENSDRGKMFLEMMKNMYEGTPYGISVIGNIKDLETVSRDQIKKYFDTYYVPNNVVMVIVGDVKAKKVFREFEKRFGDIPKSKNLEKIKKKHLASKGFDFKGKYNRWVKLNGTSPNPRFILAYKAEKIGTPDSFILEILASILGEGDSSFLSQQYVLSKRPQLASAYAAYFSLQESGLFFFGGELLGHTNLPKFRQGLYHKIKKSCHQAITKRSLQKVKNQYLIGMVSGLDTNAGVASFIGNREIYMNDYNFYKKEMDIYNSITVKQLKDKCVKYLNRKDSIFFSIWKNHPVRR